MAILSVRATEGTMQPLDGPGADLRIFLANALVSTPASAPVVIMVHGYSHHPDMASADPARHIFATDRTRLGPRQTSWPLSMNFDATDTGLCLPFSWPGRIDGSETKWQRLNRFSTIYHRSQSAGRQLAQLIGWIGELAPDRPVHLLAHSLGSRVAATALAHTRSRSVNRVILMGAALLASEATHLLATSAAARNAEFFNITARQNDVFDLLFEWIAPKRAPGDHSIGAGLGRRATNWLDIQLDHPRTRNILGRLGIGLAPMPPRMTHSGFYDHPGTLAFYRTLFDPRTAPGFDVISHAFEGFVHEPRGTHLRPVLDHWLTARSGPLRRART